MVCSLVGTCCYMTCVLCVRVMSQCHDHDIRLHSTFDSTRSVVGFASVWTAATTAKPRDVMLAGRRSPPTVLCPAVYLSQRIVPRWWKRFDELIALRSPLLTADHWRQTNNWPAGQQWAAARSWHLAHGWPSDRRLHHRLTFASTTCQSVHRARTVQRAAANRVLSRPSDNGADPVGVRSKSARRKKNKKYKEISPLPAEGHFFCIYFRISFNSSLRSF